MTRDAHDLAVLDDRMRAAAGRLHTTVVARLAETPVVVEPQPLPVAPRRVQRGGLPATATAVAVAAAFLIGCLAAVVVTGDDGDLTEAGEPVDLAASHDWLVPTGFPDEDDELIGAELQPPSSHPQISGEIVAYGDGWAGPRLVLSQGRFGPDTFAPGADVESITVAGHPARITGASGGTIEVTWGGTAHETRISADGLTREQVLDAAAHVKDGSPVVGADGPSIEAAGLPDDFVELGRGPVSYWGDARGTEELGGLTLEYGLEGVEQSMAWLQLTQRPGTREELGLMPLLCETYVEFQLFGGPAYDCGGGGIVVFYDPGSQQIVEITAVSYFDGRAREFAESLEPASQREVEELVAPFAPGPLPEPGPGELSLETKMTDGEPWRVLANDGTTGSYDVAVQTRQGRVTQHLDAAGGWRDIYLNLAEGGSGRTGDLLVFGTVPYETDELVVEYSNLEPQRVDLTGISGWPVSLYATHLESDGADATLVARDWQGNELARLTPDVYLAGMDSAVPGPMATTDDPATTACPATRTFDDGTKVCLL